MYAIRDKPDRVKEKWEAKKVEYITHLSSIEIRSSGGSLKYGTGGRWKDGNIYISIGGYASRLGMPVKLRTSDGIIPISPTDVKELVKAKLIKSVQPYKNEGTILVKKE